MTRDDTLLIEQRVREFIAENFYVSDVAALGGEDSLLESGVMDSTGVLELTAFLEAEYRIPIQESEITPENLETIDRIVRFVVRKHQS